MKFYRYKKCSTCVKAINYLNDKSHNIDIIEIRDQAPSIQELEVALNGVSGELKKIINTSGMDYRKLGLKDKLADLSQSEVLKLLSENGNLVKRPVLVINDSKVICGFKEDIYNQLLV